MAGVPPNSHAAWRGDDAAIDTASPDLFFGFFLFFFFSVLSFFHSATSTFSKRENSYGRTSSSAHSYRTVVVSNTGATARGVQGYVYTQLDRRYTCGQTRNEHVRRRAQQNKHEKKIGRERASGGKGSHVLLCRQCFFSGLMTINKRSHKKGRFVFSPLVCASLPPSAKGESGPY